MPFPPCCVLRRAAWAQPAPDGFVERPWDEYRCAGPLTARGPPLLSSRQRRADAARARRPRPLRAPPRGGVLRAHARVGRATLGITHPAVGTIGPLDQVGDLVGGARQAPERAGEARPRLGLHSFCICYPPFGFDRHTGTAAPGSSSRRGTRGPGSPSARPPVAARDGGERQRIRALTPNTSFSIRRPPERRPRRR